MQAEEISRHAAQLHQAGRLAEAVAAYSQLIALDPTDPEAHYTLGNTYLEMGKTDQALASFLDAKRLAPGHPQILLQLGNAFAAKGQPADAATILREALLADSGDVAIHYNLGNALRELGQPEQAAAGYRAALKLAPSDADAHNNLGNVLRELDRLDEAITCYETALQLNPDLHHAKVHLIHQKQHICDWQGLDSEIQQVRSLVADVPQAQVSPFAFLSMPGTTAAEQKSCSENWSQNRFNGLIKNQLNFNPRPSVVGKKLHIAYLSSDFRLHPLAFLITELMELHDRNRFEIFAYSCAPDDKTPERQRLEKAFDHFVDIRFLSLTAAAQRINDDQIDILVDLTGFTNSSRSGIAALRPAPIQVNWLGFPGTMGGINSTPLFDYLLTDAFVTPIDEAGHYSEKLAFLPDCYQPNNHKRPVAKLPGRMDCGLREDMFVFCCFNQSFKILPQMFDIWMRLLQSKPHSVLWLLECNRWAKTNLRREAALRGIDPERLIFAPRVPIADHLARHSLADLFLDTLPYNAHTTASDALWMGLPVITCSGETFAGRVAGSLLGAARLPELVTHTTQAYEKLAIRLAENPAELAAIRHKLIQARENLPLFDTPRFARQLEQGYSSMWLSHATGQSPQSFSVMIK